MKVIYKFFCVQVLLLLDFTVFDESEYKNKLLRSIEIGAYPDTVPDYDNCHRSGRVGMVQSTTKHIY